MTLVNRAGICICRCNLGSIANICKDHITEQGSDDLRYQNRKGKTQSINMESYVTYNTIHWVLDSDNKKMLASIGRDSEKSS